MPRIARKDSQSNFHHIIVQGLNKECIFKKEEDMKKYREIIIEKLNNSDITILAYCIMSNHTHFLIYSDKYKNISRFMQRVNTSYSRWYNKENNRVGFVFRNRFYSQDILNENQLYNCSPRPQAQEGIPKGLVPLAGIQGAEPLGVLPLGVNAPCRRGS